MSSLTRIGVDPKRRFRQVHFVGIGGTGMCGIAEVMLNLGHQISGSDQNASPVTERLEQLGARIHIGHHADHLGDAKVVVISSAIGRNNPEVKAAKARRIPIVPRAEMLGELMRFRDGIAVAGTHGKTTTTSLVAAILFEGKMDPTFVIGGLLNSLGTNARLGSGQFIVAEADESDGSFLLLQPTMAVVTNIDNDHLSTYRNDFARLKRAFDEFLHHLPFYGLAVMCVDDPSTAELAARISRTVVTYGLSEQADIRALNVEQTAATMAFDVQLPGRNELMPVKLNLPGVHNVRNALAALAIGWELGIEDRAMQQALSGFAGIGRRFNVHGEIAVGQVKALFVDDYGHHPTELDATLEAARSGWPERRLVAVFQPHRYTRTRDLLDDFARVLSQVDLLILADVYAAGEVPIAGADSRALARAIRARGKVDPVLVDHPSDCRQILPSLVADDDLVLLLGAGDIGSAAADIYRDGFPEATNAH
ncbi:MAG: UDP-N-acetylmuramate--L-alanine ligase [Lysobacterales bacterium]